LAILLWTLPKNIGGNGFTISKLKENTSFHIPNEFLSISEISNKLAG